eukprot:scaffold223_cov408-Prasinococcus_capsulatus_cf.AAC.5
MCAVAKAARTDVQEVLCAAWRGAVRIERVTIQGTRQDVKAGQPRSNVKQIARILPLPKVVVAGTPIRGVGVLPLTSPGPLEHGCSVIKGSSLDTILLRASLSWRRSSGRVEERTTPDPDLATVFFAFGGVNMTPRSEFGNLRSLAMDRTNGGFRGFRMYVAKSSPKVCHQPIHGSNCSSRRSGRSGRAQAPVTLVMLAATLATALQPLAVLYPLAQPGVRRRAAARAAAPVAASVSPTEGCMLLHPAPSSPWPGPRECPQEPRIGPKRRSN